MHSFRPPARVDAKDLVRQGYDLRRRAQIIGNPEPAWQYNVSPGTYEQLLMVGGREGFIESYGQFAFSVKPSPDGPVMTLFGIPVHPMEEAGEATITLSYADSATFKVTL